MMSIKNTRNKRKKLNQPKKMTTKTHGITGDIVHNNALWPSRMLRFNSWLFSVFSSVLKENLTLSCGDPQHQLSPVSNINCGS
jgi:hypothetical protein